MTTPIRKGLQGSSRLQPLVGNGLQAMEAAHRKYIDEGIRSEFADSLDIDKAFVEGHEHENRWDYLLGHRDSEKILALEPHSANNKELSTIIRKRAASLQHLVGHLRPGVFVAEWFVVASGRVDFIPMEKATARLAQHGIRFVGKKVLGKFLPPPKGHPTKSRR